MIPHDRVHHLIWWQYVIYQTWEVHQPQQLSFCVAEGPIVRNRLISTFSKTCTQMSPSVRSLPQQDPNLCVKPKSSQKEDPRLAWRNYPTCFKISALDGLTKPKQCQAMEIPLELSYPLALRFQVCRSSCVQVLWRGMNCKEVRHYLKNQVANKTKSTLKLLSRNVHFTAISAVSDNCLRIQK